MAKKIIVSGMRPTGCLHFGNYFGALENWVKLQDDYDCHFFIADWHALTTGYADTSEVRENTYQLIADYIAAGLDPDRSVLFLQSEIKEHAELHLLLSMVTPLAWLERCPTYKDQIQNMADKDIMTYGFLGYPCLMAADILMYRADCVPVGEDQVPHLEMTREIARRMNYIYQSEIFPEPQPLLTKAKLLPGTDGRKMSKSYGNTISFADTPDEVNQKVMGMITDPARIRKTDPGHPEICTVYAFHKIFLGEEECGSIGEACRAGQIGCVQCKRRLAAALKEYHTPIHDKRMHLLSDRRMLREIILQGTDKARTRARETMKAVNGAVRIGLSDD